MKAEARVELDDGTEVRAEVEINRTTEIAGNTPRDRPAYAAVGALAAAVQAVEAGLGVPGARYVTGGASS